MNELKDRYFRTIDYMRISITDRCNLRCLYCMPADGVSPEMHRDILRYEEIIRVIKVAARLGVSKIRLTGGEPLTRRNISFLIICQQTPRNIVYNIMCAGLSMLLYIHKFPVNSYYTCNVYRGYFCYQFHTI